MSFRNTRPDSSIFKGVPALSVAMMWNVALATSRETVPFATFIDMSAGLPFTIAIVSSVAIWSMIDLSTGGSSSTAGRVMIVVVVVEDVVVDDTADRIG